MCGFRCRLIFAAWGQGGDAQKKPWPLDQPLVYGIAKSLVETGGVPNGGKPAEKIALQVARGLVDVGRRGQGGGMVNGWKK